MSVYVSLQLVAVLGAELLRIFQIPLLPYLLSQLIRLDYLHLNFVSWLLHRVNCYVSVVTLLQGALQTQRCCWYLWVIITFSFLFFVLLFVLDNFRCRCLHRCHFFERLLRVTMTTVVELLESRSGSKVYMMAFFGVDGQELLSVIRLLSDYLPGS